MIDVKKLAEMAGMNVSLWDYGAGSMVFTMGIEGLARGAVERFAVSLLEAAAVEAQNLSDEDFYCDGVSGAYRAAARVRAMKPAKEQKT